MINRNKKNILNFSGKNAGKTKPRKGETSWQ
jgi:hypothetical protein